MQGPSMTEASEGGHANDDQWPLWKAAQWIVEQQRFVEARKPFERDKQIVANEWWHETPVSTLSHRWIRDLAGRCPVCQDRAVVVDSFPRLAARTLNFSLGLPRE